MMSDTMCGNCMREGHPDTEPNPAGICRHAHDKTESCRGDGTTQAYFKVCVLCSVHYHYCMKCGEFIEEHERSASYDPWENAKRRYFGRPGSE